MQTQEDHSHPIPALNVDSLKVDLVVIQNTCSEKEDSNSETASSKLVKECSLNSETKDVHAIKYKMSKAKERCMAYFRSLHSHLQVLSKADLKGTHVEHGFRREFMSIFGQDVDTFTSTMLLNVDQLQKQLDKDEFQEDGSMAAFWVVNNQFQKFINSKFTLDYDSQMTDTYFVEYTGLEVQHFRDTLLQHLGNVKKSVAERTRHQRQYERRVNKRQMQTQESKIDTGKALDADLVWHGKLSGQINSEDESAGNSILSNLKMHCLKVGCDQSKTTEQTTSLLANNAELKAQIQEKVFAIAALKNDLRKLKRKWKQGVEFLNAVGLRYPHIHGMQYKLGWSLRVRALGSVLWGLFGHFLLSLLVCAGGKPGCGGAVLSSGHEDSCKPLPYKSNQWLDLMMIFHHHHHLHHKHKHQHNKPLTLSQHQLLFLKEGEYDIWAMKMEHYLAHTDYPIWEVIQRGNGPVSVSTDTNGVIKVLPPKTAEEILARERERKARTTLLMALPEDHLAKFHKMTDAKEMWEAIKSRFGGNDESKKMQKYILKQQFEGFSVSNSEGLHKGYDRFQSLLSQLEIHGAGVSTEDANQKFLRSLPSAWSQVSLIMRTKPGVDSLSFDDLYNNLRVFESDVKGSTASSSSNQNVAFVSENTSSTNEVSTAYGVSNSFGHNSQSKHPSSYSFLANQSSCPQLDHEDLEQLDEFDLEEMDLKWQVAMISMRMKKFYKKTGRKLQFDAKEPVGFDKTKVECYNCHKTGHFARECRSKGNQDSRRRDAWNTGNKDKDNGRRSGKQEESKALVTLDGEGVDWTSHSEDEQENYALMAYSSSGSDTEVTSCSKECKESYAKIKKLYDEQREQLGDASIEIQAYTQALKKVEAQLVAHQQNQLWYEEKIRFMKIDLDDKTDVLTYHKKLLAEAEKEKEELKAKVEKWHNSSKSLNILLNSQMSARDKAGLGYGDQMNKGVLSYENEVFGSLFDSRSSDIEDSPVNNRYAEGMHAVPPPMTGIYIPSGPDKEIDDSQFTYGPKQSKPSESDARSSDFTSCESNSSEETHESMPETVVNEPKVVSQPKVWTDAPIIEEYELDSDDEHVSLPSKEQETPSFANTIKHVKTSRQTLKQQNTCSKILAILLRRHVFHEKRMAKQAEVNKKMCKGTGQRENRPVWNNVNRVNHQNQFVPTVILTRTGKIQVNTARASSFNNVNTVRASSTKNVSTARHKFNSQAVPTNAARKVHTVKPIVNNVRPKTVFHKTYSHIRRPFNRTTASKTIFSNQKVNIAEVKSVSVVGGKWETAVKPSAGCN
ncbi:ribonuclease H-like domain-containing protein [Tanacetum coccineum]|uniref:Ribonuclease H-like domain-containing protein n=1 Tax=Tanacetum coccineum TaxID=301880 RepID=A0ABQ5APX9_9ASTR